MKKAIALELLLYLQGNHMYSDLEEVQKIIGYGKANQFAKNVYIWGTPAFFGLAEIVEYLIERGFDVNAANKDNGFTALHEAAVTGQEKVVQLLLKHGANKKATDESGDTPLDKAVYFNREEVIELLK